MLERLRIESDGRLLRTMGGFLLLGMGLISYVVTVKFEVAIPDYPPEVKQAEPDPGFTVRILNEPPVRNIPVNRPARNQASQPKSGRGVGKAAPTQLNVSAISSLTDDVSLSPESILGSVFNREVERVINQVSVLTRTGPNRVGARKGRPHGSFDEIYTPGDGEGRELVLDNIWERGPGSFRHDVKGPVGIQSRAITVTQENSERSSESILRSIKQHMPGLRYVYNRHLKLHPGFHGNLTLRFTISPSGIVLDLAQVSSTTGVSGFDGDVHRQVLTWRFEPVRGGGNDVVTVPFTFSE